MQEEEEEWDFLVLEKLHTILSLGVQTCTRRVYMREILGPELDHSPFMREPQTSFVDGGMDLALQDTGEFRYCLKDKDSTARAIDNIFHSCSIGGYW